ncbi:MAG: zf-HC2 domain-containing protein [Chloroflexota bacterium]
MKHTHGSECRELLGTISTYVDGSLQEDLCQELERHLAECENCRVVVDTMKKTISLYQTTAGGDVVPTGVRERLLKRLELEEFINKGR